MKISPDEPVVSIALKLLLYAIKETIVPSLIFLIGGILLENHCMSIVPLMIIFCWIQGYVTGRIDE